MGDVGDEISAMHLEQDVSNAVIEEGSDVRSQDDETVGSVHRVIFDPATGHPSALVVRKGWLFTEDVELPASLIASVDDQWCTSTSIRSSQAAPAGRHRSGPARDLTHRWPSPILTPPSLRSCPFRNSARCAIIGAHR